MDMPWISAYKPRDWSLYEVSIPSEERDLLLRSSQEIEDNELFVCGGESEKAKDWWERSHSVKGLFFFDIEQVWSMGFDKAYGGYLLRLVEEWKGHPKDSLVFVTYKGVDEDSRFFTIGVAK